jgi:hypothetical protein
LFLQGIRKKIAEHPLRLKALCGKKGARKNGQGLEVAQEARF